MRPTSLLHKERFLDVGLNYYDLLQPDSYYVSFRSAPFRGLISTAILQTDIRL